MSNIRDERELLAKPGDTISETLTALKMTQAQLAERMGKTPSKINDIISGKEPLTRPTALALEKVLGIDAIFWLNLEMNYREKLSRLDQEEALLECMDWLAIQPTKELKKIGAIKSTKAGAEMANEFLRFYGVASPKQWEALYVNQYANANFRRSETHKTTLGAMAAWLRLGEIGMRGLELQEYDKDTFKDKLPQIKSLIREHPEDFATQLQELCAEAGVAVVYTMSILKAPVSGATRWIGGHPLIQLTDRYKSNDHFWFTVFHETGHIFLHGKKEIFIEDFEGYEQDEEKEKEANQFAIKWLFPADIEAEFTDDIDEKTIRKVARKYNTHPAIVVGRLQHLKKVPYSFGNDLKIKVVLDNVINF